MGIASEPYARRKLDLCRERNPEIDYYNDEYLVLLTADTVRETAFSDYTLAACEALMAARGPVKEKPMEANKRKGRPLQPGDPRENIR